MLTRTFVIAALTASLMAVGASPSLAGAKSSPRFPGWYDTNATAAQGRANLLENKLTVAGAFGCGSASEPPSVVTAYNATTGAVLWQDTEQTFDLEGLNQAAVVAPYVITAGQDAAGYFVDVLNLSNGTLVWSGGECFTDGPVLPLVVARVVMSYSCAGMQASNLATGTTLWTLHGGWTFQSADLTGTAGKHLYATSPTGTVDSLNPLTGKVEYSLSQAVTVLAVDLSRVYATCGSGGKFVCAYNISTGARKWQDTTLGAKPALAAEADGVLYLDFGGALNAKTGKVIKKLWTKFNGTPATAIAVGQGRIAVVTNPRVLDLYGLPGS